MIITLKMMCEENETPVSLAKGCRSDEAFTCPMPSGCDCPLRKNCKEVKAQDWKKFFKSGGTFTMKNTSTANQVML